MQYSRSQARVGLHRGLTEVPVHGSMSTLDEHTKYPPEREAWPLLPYDRAALATRKGIGVFTPCLHTSAGQTLIYAYLLANKRTAAPHLNGGDLIKRHIHAVQPGGLGCAWCVARSCLHCKQGQGDMEVTLPVHTETTHNLEAQRGLNNTRNLNELHESQPSLEQSTDSR